MKVNWNNIDEYKVTKSGNFVFINVFGLCLVEECLICGDPFFVKKQLYKNGKGKYCSKKCSANATKHIRPIGDKHHMYGKHHSDESKKKIKDKVCGENHNRWKGGLTEKNLCSYGHYEPQLSPYGVECRRSPDDENVLEVRCHYEGCKKWYRPNRHQVYNKIKCLNGLKGDGEQNIYCSDQCKRKCPSYGKSPGRLERIDGIKSGNIIPLQREVQPQLRDMVFERDRWQCQRCGYKGYIECHHIDPVKNNPIESADIDNCITFCKECHEKSHTERGCRINDLRNRICQ